MTEEEFTEQLADEEHARWSRWQAYVHSLCEKREDGALVIPASRVQHWKWEIATAYADLPEEIKHWDREEVKHILPIIRAYVGWLRQESREMHAVLQELGVPHIYVSGEELGDAFSGGAAVPQLPADEGAGRIVSEQRDAGPDDGP